MVRQRTAGVSPDGRSAVGRPARTYRPEVVHGCGQRAAAGRLVRAVEGGELVRAVRVVCGPRPEHGSKRGAGPHVRWGDGGTQAQGPPLFRIHVHHNVGIVRGLSHVHGSTVAYDRYDQYGRTYRIVRDRRASGKYTCTTLHISLAPERNRLEIVHNTKCNNYKLNLIPNRF